MFSDVKRVLIKCGYQGYQKLGTVKKKRRGKFWEVFLYVLCSMVLCLLYLCTLYFDPFRDPPSFKQTTLMGGIQMISDHENRLKNRMVLSYEPIGKIITQEDKIKLKTDKGITPDRKKKLAHKRPKYGMVKSYDPNGTNITKEIVIEVNADEEIIPTGRNNTKNTKYLVYNRVPKCGSTTIINYIKGLQSKNKFKFKHSDAVKVKGHVLNKNKTERLIKQLRIDAGGKKLLYDRHFYYLEWHKFGFNPTLINVVRDPVERVISKFYYDRSEKRWKTLRREEPREKEEWYQKTLEQCLFSPNDSECKFGHEGQEMMTTYFCGTAWECHDRYSEKALQLAKKHIEEEYSVVGLLEDMNQTMILLENYIPEFFSGAASYYNAKRLRGNTNKHQDQSEAVIQKLRSELSMDIELYDFVKQRFNAQINHLFGNPRN